ncbi:MAG: tyrosine-protein phosphatase [Massiliimalia sp.]|jgi:protein-tyrosine phosphatase
MNGLADLHTHILPGMDDGAAGIEESLRLIRREIKDGVSHIALTSHFNFERQDMETFLKRRQTACEALREACYKKKLEVNLYPGAEVYFSAKLLEVDPTPLCMEGNSVLLVEFPRGYYPEWAEDVFYRLNLMGITPLIAHVERYPHFAEHPNDLLSLVENGAYVQTNASALVSYPKVRKRIFTLIKHHLVHVVSTDTHSLEKRPPMLGQAFSMISEKLGMETANRLCQNGRDLIQGKLPQEEEPSPVRFFLGKAY